MSWPPPPEEQRYRRPPTSKGRLWSRRLLALVVVGGVLAAVVWLGVQVNDGLGGDERAEPTTTAQTLPLRPFRVIFPEGFTRRQMADRMEAVAEIAERERGRNVLVSEKTYLSATRRARRIPGFGPKRYPLEGFLFPASYEFGTRTRSKDIAAQQLLRFEDAWDGVDLRYAKSKNLTPYDVLIIASMIEKEAVAPEERAKIAAVIYNRLHERMTLGIDATIRYGLNIPPTESIRQSQLDGNNPYNTRRLHGLPPTPIANPGLASIRAAARPAKVDYLYFVRRPDKVHHFFTRSREEFDAYARAHGFG